MLTAFTYKGSGAEEIARRVKRIEEFRANPRRKRDAAMIRSIFTRDGHAGTYDPAVAEAIIAEELISAGALDGTTLTVTGRTLAEEHGEAQPRADLHPGKVAAGGLQHHRLVHHGELEMGGRVVDRHPRVLGERHHRERHAGAVAERRAVAEHEQAIAAREEWLEQARKALEEYSG